MILQKKPYRDVRGVYDLPTDTRKDESHRNLVIPYDKQSRERIVEQMARAMTDCDGWLFDRLEGHDRQEYIDRAEAALASIEPEARK